MHNGVLTLMTYSFTNIRSTWSTTGLLASTSD